MNQVLVTVSPDSSKKKGPGWLPHLTQSSLPVACPSLTRILRDPQDHTWGLVAVQCYIPHDSPVAGLKDAAALVIAPLNEKSQKAVQAMALLPGSGWWKVQGWP